MPGLQTTVGRKREVAGEGTAHVEYGTEKKAEHRTLHACRIFEPEGTSFNRKLVVPAHGWSAPCPG